MLVCADLQLQGWEVYRAVAACSSCDVIAVRADRLLRIEIRTGRKGLNGQIIYPLKSKYLGRQDLFAVVLLDDKSVRYFKSHGVLGSPKNTPETLSPAQS